MTRGEDIVKRLRDASEYRRDFGSGSGEVFDLAADEIERSRGLADQLAAVTKALIETIDRYPLRAGVVPNLEQAREALARFHDNQGTASVAK